MTKTGGENTLSTQVEEQLLTCPQVAVAIVIAIPNARWGEAFTGSVILTEGANADEPAILKQVSTRLGAFQMLTELVSIDSLQTMATGKLRKVEMRHEYADLYEDEPF